MQHRAEVEHLVVELDAVGGGERGRELVAALAVGRDDRRALSEEPLHLGGERSSRCDDEITGHAVTGLAAIAASCGNRRWPSVAGVIRSAEPARTSTRMPPSPTVRCVAEWCQ